MEARASLIEELVLNAVGMDAEPSGEAQSLDAIARRSGIKGHEVERVLTLLELRTPPAVRRLVDERGATSWELSAAGAPTAEQVEVAAVGS